jgi:hypothetical protein
MKARASAVRAELNLAPTQDVRVSVDQIGSDKAHSIPLSGRKTSYRMLSVTCHLTYEPALRSMVAPVA